MTNKIKNSINKNHEIEESTDELDVLESQDEDEILSISPVKTGENLASINTDDSVKIYLQQIGKIPLLNAEQELEVAKKIKLNIITNSRSHYYHILQI